MGGGQLSKMPVKGLAQPNALAWDWMAKNLYILDQDTARIDLVNLQSGFQCNVLSDNLQQPSGLAIDPVTG